MRDGNWFAEQIRPAVESPGVLVGYCRATVASAEANALDPSLRSG